jgi:glucuronate isomerase
MKNFLDDDFLLNSKTAQCLYHDYVKDLPIIDYHCHLSPKAVFENKKFSSLTEAWLDGDHYKWRAMRTHGIEERYCSGEASDWEKFEKWADTVPYTLRNPLYHWTHLELRRYFNIPLLLSPETARDIYHDANAKLDQLSTNRILEKMKVELICTTDDPVSDLKYHRDLQWEGTKMLPTFRADNVLAIDDLASWNSYMDRLGSAAGVNINSYDTMIEALRQRHTFFHEAGCMLSDHGLETIYFEEFTDKEIQTIFHNLRNNNPIDEPGRRKYMTAVLIRLAEMDHAKGWTQQFHLGALRNNNSRLMEKLGPDTGFDSIGDLPIAKNLSRFLDTLDKQNKLTKTILYNLNPTYNEVFATMIGNFNDGSVPGKLQFGTGWWFLDQKDGMERQMNALSNMGLISHFVGMLTDSRSFLSFPRHEYFRRLLCDLFGRDVENGELPSDIEWLGKIVSDISYHNAKNYFEFAGNMDKETDRS